MKKCTCCNGIDQEGLINGMCIDCFDMYLDIGKGFTDEQKRDLEKRRAKNGYYSKEVAV